MIIVEGPDGAGKSTLVKELAREFGLQVGERGVADRSKLYTVTRSDTYNALGHAVGGTSPVRIWDRLFYSELVYAPVVGRKVEFSQSERAYVTRMIDALRCPVVVCLPDYATVAENVEGSEQMKGVREGLVGIYNHYVELVATEVFPPHCLLYDYEWVSPSGDTEITLDRGPYALPFSSLDRIKDEITDYLEERRERTS